MAEQLQCDRCKAAQAGHVKRYMDTVVGVTATGWEFVVGKLLCSRCIDALRAWLQPGPATTRLDIDLNVGETK